MATMVNGDMVFKQPAFYAKAAVEHGGMSAYYFRQLATGRDCSNNLLDEYSLKWAVDKAESEAVEAWHFARLLNDDQVAAEIAKQAAQQRLDDELLF